MVSDGDGRSLVVMSEGKGWVLLIRVVHSPFLSVGEWSCKEGGFHTDPWMQVDGCGQLLKGMDWQTPSHTITIPDPPRSFPVRAVIDLHHQHLTHHARNCHIEGGYGGNIIMLR